MRQPFLALAVLALAAGPAWGQANIAPDPVPRVQPPGMQELPVEDRQFVETAAALSRIQTEIAETAVARAQDAAVKELAQRIAEQHRTLLDEVRKLAQMQGVDLKNADPFVPDQGGPGGAASAVTAPEHAPNGTAMEVLRTLSEAPPEQFGPAFAEGQIAIHDRLVDLYQTEAGNSPVEVLRTFAITRLVDIQQTRDAVEKLAVGYGIAVDPQEGQPLQYRNGRGD